MSWVAGTHHNGTLAIVIRFGVGSGKFRAMPDAVTTELIDVFDIWNVHFPWLARGLHDMTGIEHATLHATIARPTRDSNFSALQIFVPMRRLQGRYCPTIGVPE